VKKQADLQASFDAQQQLALRSSALAVEFSRAEADVRRLDGALRELDSQIKDVALAASRAALNITVVEPAYAEPAPVSPRPMHAGGIMLGAGLLLGLALGLVRERVDPRVRSSDDVRSTIGIPVVGLIPHIPRLQSHEAHGWLVHLDPTSPAAEGYRSLHTALQVGAAAELSRKILVTSPSPRDGRSTLASNLAMAIAMSGRRVVLVDADFRSPAQHRLFGVSNDVGFSSALLAGELVDRAVRRTTIEHLHVMPAGPVPADSTQLLNSAALGDLLEDLAKQFDHVVIDSPAVLEADDARIIAAACDLSLLVVRAERSNSKQAAAARDALLTVGARIFGVVLNDMTAASTNRPSSGGYVTPPPPGRTAAPVSKPAPEEVGLTPGERRRLTGSDEKR
jgi:polysaccharide biosynthesis transport protein